MAQFDLHNNIYPESALNFVNITANGTSVGHIIDMSGRGDGAGGVGLGNGYESLEFILTADVITDGAYAITVEEGDESDLSDAAAVDSDFLIGTLADAAFAEADDYTTKRIGYAGKKRYVRINVVATAVTTGGNISILAILGNPRCAPTESDPWYSGAPA